MDQMNGFLPISKKLVNSMEGVKLQNKLFRIVFLHLFAFFMAIALETTVFVLIKQGILTYLAFYCRQTMFTAAITLYLVLLLSTGIYGIFNMTEFAVDNGAITVYFLICIAQITSTYFLGRYFVDYYQSLNSKLRDRLLGNNIPRVESKVERV